MPFFDGLFPSPHSPRFPFKTISVIVATVYFFAKERCDFKIRHRVSWSHWLFQEINFLLISSPSPQNQAFTHRVGYVCVFNVRVSESVRNFLSRNVLYKYLLWKYKIAYSMELLCDIWEYKRKLFYIKLWSIINSVLFSRSIHTKVKINSCYFNWNSVFGTVQSVPIRISIV